MDRRYFGKLAAGASILMGTKGFAGVVQPEQLRFVRNGWMPNNPELPVLLYRDAFAVGEDTDSRMEAAFERNG